MFDITSPTGMHCSCLYQEVWFRTSVAMHLQIPLISGQSVQQESTCDRLCTLCTLGAYSTAEKDGYS